MSEEVVGTDEAMWSGRVAIYRAPDGGAVIALHRDGDDDTENHRIPAMAVAMFEKMSSGKGGVLRMLGGMRHDGT
jgi:hypothetical protein